MPRNGSGTFTLVSGNPVVTGTTIEASWANTTLSDIATTLSDSLSRSGQGGMTAALRVVDGTSSSPGVAFASETTTGFYRAGTNDVRFVIATNELQKWTPSGVTFNVDLSLPLSNNLTWGGAYGAGTPAISGTSNGLQFYPAGSTSGESMRLNASGNLGLGVTPSAQGVYRTMQFGNYTTIGQQTTGTAQSFFGWNVRGSSTANQYLYNVTADKAALYEIYSDASHRWSVTNTSGTAGNAISFTQAMTLDASGNLGIGGIAPAARVHIFGPASSSANMIWQANGGAGTAYWITAKTSGLLAIGGNGGTEPASGALNIDNTGNLLVGLTSPTFVSTRTEILAATNNNALGAKTTQNNYAPLMAWNSATTGDNLFQYFYTEGTLTLRGSIDYNRAGGLVRYNTTSDYRAKDILGPVANPGATIDALKVYEGRMKGATQSRPMLVAHEAQEVTPYAVSGEKDEVNEDGTPKFQQIDVSSLVPLLLAEIQSLRARVAALEA
jgi:hypothetical protein